MPRPTPLAWALAALAVPVVASAIVLGQTDDFEGGTTQAWRHGGPSPVPPTNVASGGPQGAGDAYLRVVALGSVSPGGRLVAFNTQQWTGDYIGAGIDVIRADVKNPDGSALPLRVGFESTTTRYVSTDPFLIPGDGAWHEVLFDLTQMSNVGGGATLEEVLADVRTARLISAADAPAWQGDPVAAEFGIDNIEAQAAAVDVGPHAPGPAIVLASRPNPFSGTPMLELSLPSASRVTLDIFDIAGRHALSRDLGSLGAGVQAVLAAGVSQLAPGVWFFRVRTPEGTAGTLRVVKID